MSNQGKHAKQRHEDQLAAALGFLSFLEYKQVFPSDKPTLTKIFKEYSAHPKSKEQLKQKISLPQALFLLSQEGHCKVIPASSSGGPRVEWAISEENVEGEVENDWVYLFRDAEQKADAADKEKEEKRLEELKKKHAEEEAAAQKARAEKANDLKKKKHRIRITDPVIFDPMTIGTEQTQCILIRNAGTNSQTLVSITPLKKNSEFALEDKLKVCTGEAKATIVATQEYEVYVTCKPKNIGKLKYTLNFDFGSFMIQRLIEVSVTDGKEYKELLPIEPVQIRKPLPVFNFPKKIVEGEKPPIPDSELPLVTLSEFLAPKWINEKKPNEVKALVEEKMKAPLESKTYIDHFSLLLHLEEKQMSMDVRSYDMFKVSVEAENDASRVWLEVPGLAENRPALYYGDRLYLTPSKEDGDSKDDDQPKYEAYVHRIDKERVLLGLHDIFGQQHVGGKLYDVQFAFDRTTMRRRQQAISLSNRLNQQTLFPPAEPTLTKALVVIDDQNFKLHDRVLNSQQQRAVKAIVEGQMGAVPYLILGPPGTGKTVTMVESIKQLRDYFPKGHVLATAPSNTAADVLVERLRKHIDKKDIIRINHFQRPKSDVASDVFEVCSYDETKGMFTFPPLSKVKSYGIVVCTTVTAGLFVNMGLEQGHFSHILIDEAGQADEPETLVSISGLAGPDTRIAMAGDPQQLGPVIRSAFGAHYGLGLSFFERLTQAPVYQRYKEEEEVETLLGKLFDEPAESFYEKTGKKKKDQKQEKKEEKKTESYKEFGYYNPYFCTKLLQNYRSHPAILQLPSILFYHNELVASADEKMRNSFCKWDELPCKDNFPVIFHGVIGVDIQEGNSPSWFNPTEAILVHNYIEKLQKYKASGFDLSQVGIISPFRKQVEKIRTLLKGRSMQQVKVGSVEDFQGQERRVIIVSLVRSSSQYLEFDLKYNIGFLKHPKRFNVAVTRAQCLVIVIGNPYILMEDLYWGAFLRWCIKSNAYVGCSPPSIQDAKMTKEEEELWRQREALEREPEEDEEEEKKEEEEDDEQQGRATSKGDYDPSEWQLAEYPEWNIFQ